MLAISCRLPKKRTYAAESEKGVQPTLGVGGDAMTHRVAPQKGDVEAAAVHLRGNVVGSSPSRVPAAADWPSSFIATKQPQQHFEYVRERTKVHPKIECTTDFPCVNTSKDYNLVKNQVFIEPLILACLLACIHNPQKAPPARPYYNAS